MPNDPDADVILGAGELGGRSPELMELRCRR